MKKLVLAATIASLSFGANAITTLTPSEVASLGDFSSVKKTAKVKLKISGKVPKRCILTVRRDRTDRDVLEQAIKTADIGSYVSTGLRVANVVSWCNYGDSLDFSFKSKNGGLMHKDDPTAMINYVVRRPADPGTNLLDTAVDGQNYADSLSKNNPFEHMTTKSRLTKLFVHPQGAAIAKAGKYKDTLVVKLSASLAP
jgi:hypothetical protein